LLYNNCAGNLTKMKKIISLLIPFVLLFTSSFGQKVKDVDVVFPVWLYPSIKLPTGLQTFSIEHQNNFQDKFSFDKIPLKFSSSDADVRFQIFVGQPNFSSRIESNRKERDYYFYKHIVSTEHGIR
jgi:hypothetical protein